MANVLIVDDDLDTVELSVELLESAGQPKMIANLRERHRGRYDRGVSKGIRETLPKAIEATQTEMIADGFLQVGAAAKSVCPKRVLELGHRIVKLSSAV